MNKKKYYEAYETLNELMSYIFENSGQTWWRGPDMPDDEWYGGDVGYVYEFWKELKRYLNS